MSNPSSGGRAYEDTLIGSFLSKSCLPSVPGKPFLFFEKPKTMTERDVEIISGNMWQVICNKKKQLNELKESFRLANETLPRTIISII